MYIKANNLSSSINLNVPVFPVKKAPSYSLEGM